MAQEPSAVLIDANITARSDAKRVIRESRLTLLGECGFGMEAASIASELAPDVLIVGVSEPLERPLQTLEALHRLLPETPIIVYSNSRDIETLRKVMRSGARDFLLRPVTPKTMRSSVFAQMAAKEKKQLRRLDQTGGTPTAGVILTVFGAKGGIGKSTVTTNLAVALARMQRHSVCVVDLDNGFGDVAGMLGVKPAHTLYDLARDIDRIRRHDLPRYMSRHELSDLDILPGPTLAEWRVITLDQVRKTVDLLAKSYDIVLLDTSAMLDELVEVAVETATVAVCITTTEVASVNDSLAAMRALEMLSYPHERVRIVMNATNPHDHVRVDVVERILQREVLWTIPFDKKVRLGTHFGSPVVLRAPRSVAARSFMGLAAAIVGQRREEPGGVVGGLGQTAGATRAIIASE